MVCILIQIGQVFSAQLAAPLRALCADSASCLPGMD